MRGRDGEKKKGMLGMILLVLHLISVIGIISWLWSSNYNFSPEDDGLTLNKSLVLLQEAAP